MATFDRSVGRTVFGRDPALYARVRPGYPERVFEVLRERCGLRPGMAMLEIGPGPGLATRRLLEHGADPLVAVEPDPALAEYLIGVAKGVSIVRAPFEEAELQESSFDLGAAASSFHWVEPEIGLPKVRRLLRPGGWWAMWWNVHGDETDDPFRQATSDLLDPIEQPSWHTPRPFAQDTEGRAADLVEAGFDSIEAELIRWRQRFDTNRIRGLYATFSPIARLPDAEREELLDAIANVADTKFGGSVERPILTSLYTARRPS